MLALRSGLTLARKPRKITSVLKLIVNADDFGLSERVNDGILQSHGSGILTSASIMANGAGFEHAIGICRAVPTLDVGIHLTLVEEEPVLRTNLVPSLIDGTGRLHRHAAIFTRRYFAGTIRLEEVECELEAQIQKVMSYGITVSHLDSHQHLHMLPQVLAITIKLAKKYGIGAIRLPRETIRRYMFSGQGAARRMLQLLILNMFCRFGKNTNSTRVDEFVGFFFSGNLHKNNLGKLLECLPTSGTCELMCHPGFDDASTRYGHWGYHWSNELNALTDPEMADFLRQRNVALISYRQLAQSATPQGTASGLSHTVEATSVEHLTR
jgi:hopanoid biosynthesis associated protein HpnK